MQSVAIAVGSCTEITRKQLLYLKNNPLFIERTDIELYYLGSESFSRSADINFIKILRDFQVLIMSGGTTAYSILSTAGFEYILSGPGILPLISTGTIKGGILDGKKCIIKGGSLGDVNIYVKLVEYANINMK
jgi:uncharacterized protein YgbK (DUF1537 family)